MVKYFPLTSYFDLTVFPLFGKLFSINLFFFHFLKHQKIPKEKKRFKGTVISQSKWNFCCFSFLFIYFNSYGYNLFYIINEFFGDILMFVVSGIAENVFFFFKSNDIYVLQLLIWVLITHVECGRLMMQTTVSQHSHSELNMPSRIFFYLL